MRCARRVVAGGKPPHEAGGRYQRGGIATIAPAVVLRNGAGAFLRTVFARSSSRDRHGAMVECPNIADCDPWKHEMRS